MNDYFKLYTLDLASIDTLCVRTLPVFTKCAPNQYLNDLYAGVTEETTILDINVKDRSVLGRDDIPGLERHFHRLLVCRRDNFLPVQRRLKALVRENQLPSGMAQLLFKGNFVLTQCSSFTVDFPESITLELITLDDELSITAWIWACRILRKVYTDALTSAKWSPQCDAKAGMDDDDDDEDDDDEDPGQSPLDMLRKAATIFSFLTARGVREGFARFNRDLPIYAKAYVCRAYQSLCVATAHMLMANDLLGMSAGVTFNNEVVAHIKAASDVLEGGYDLFKNVDGADDPGIELPLAFNAIRVRTFLFYTFYLGRQHVVTDRLYKLSLDYMESAKLYERLEPQVRASMQTILDGVAGLHEDESSYLSLVWGVAKVFSLTRPVTCNAEATYLANIRALPPLPPTPLPSRTFVVPPLRALLFE